MKLILKMLLTLCALPAMMQAVCTNPVLLPTGVSASCTGSGVTSATVYVQGTSDPDVYLDLYVDGVFVCSGFSGGDGTYAFSCNTSIAPSPTIHTAQVIEQSTSCASAIQNFVFQLPTITSATIVCSPTPGSNANLEVTGYASSNELVAIYSNGFPTADGENQANPDGSFAYTFIIISTGAYPELRPGNNTISVHDTFAPTCTSGNSVTIVYDPSPVLQTVTPNDCENTITVTGTAMPGAQITIYATNQAYCNTCLASCSSSFPPVVNPVTTTFANATITCKPKHK